MQYAIDVLNAEGRRTATIGGIVAARLHEKVNSPGMLTVESLEPPEADVIVPGTGCLRVRSGREPWLEYRITGVERDRKRERNSVRIIARHIVGDTMHEVFAESAACLNRTPQELLELVLGYSAFSAGTATPAEAIPWVRFEYETVWECLQRLCGLTGGELRFDPDTREISLDAPAATGGGTFIRYGVNLLAATRTIDTRSVANRVYAIGAGDPPLTISGATTSEGREYVASEESAERYGIREAVYRDGSLEDVANLVENPALDGEYTGGLCAGWSNLGAAVARNTEPAFIVYGGVSQRVTTTTAGQGIEQNVAVTPGEAHSLLANIIIAAGTVRVRVVDGSAVYRRQQAVTGAGLVTVRLNDWSPIGGTVQVQILQEGSVPAQFYVDSVQAVRGATPGRFVAGSGADLLYGGAVRYLEAHCSAAISYDIETIDREDDAESFPGIGEAVTVIDPTIGLDVDTRVMERELDLIRPWRVKVRLDTPGRTLADTLDAIRQSQEEGQRHARRLLAEHARAAEEGSAALGFANQTMRFTGGVSADSWNGFSWGAGSLRVGEAWYAIPPGAATGLASNALVYVCFDRTASTTLTLAYDLDSAEGPDRVLVFGVSTTTSPALCRIHTPGIVS